jgi:glycosyltransferase involved in cell wall biosynthesis
METEGRKLDENLRPSRRITVIIPTRNREELLVKLVNKLITFENQITQLIIIDSSGSPCALESANDFPFDFVYEHSKISSAAYQRNLGLNLVQDLPDYVAFLDDDVVPNDLYFINLINALESEGAIGVSGVAIDPALALTGHKRSYFLRHYKRMFGLAGKIEGRVLPSAVAIPVIENESALVSAKWLIACSVWRYKAVSDLRFENFVGQSLSEDVIFSMKASQRGLLLVNPGVILHHSQELSGRPNLYNFWKMWVTNRRKLVIIFRGQGMSFVSFYWANFGQLIILFLKFLKGDTESGKGALGIIIGTFSRTKYVDAN